MDDFGGSVAGGGRYDKMIGKFTGQDTPACGFSIGFERIVMLLNGYEVPKKGAKKAYLLEKNMPKEGMLKVLSMAKRTGSRKTGTDRQHEEEQEVPEGAAAGKAMKSSTVMQILQINL